MNTKIWNKYKWFNLVDSIQSKWKIDNVHTYGIVKHTHDIKPYFVNHIGPVCEQILRKKYRIDTFGYICKVKLNQGRKHIFTNSFIKELSLDCTKQSPINELYATLCASYLRHNKKIPGLAYCYGFVSGVLKYFSTEISTSVVKELSNPTQHGFRIKQRGQKYSKIERVNEPCILLFQEYFELTFDDVLEEWDKLPFQIATKHLISMLIQIAEAIYHMETEWGIHHNDLHLGNIMARKRPDNTYQWTIIDWGRCTIQRQGCQILNSVFKQENGPAWGQLKMCKFPFKPSSEFKYIQAAPGSDLVCLLVMLLKEEGLIQKILLSPSFNIIQPWFPVPEITEDDLNCFRQANEWANMNSDTLSIRTFIQNLRSIV